MISNCPRNSRFRKELRVAIIELEWLGHHAGSLSSQEIIHHLRNSIERQKELVGQFKGDQLSSLEESELDDELKALRNAQRHGLFQVIRRFRLCGIVDCPSRMGKGMGYPNVLGACSGMEPSNS